MDLTIWYHFWIREITWKHSKYLNCNIFYNFLKLIIYPFVRRQELNKCWEFLLCYKAFLLVKKKRDSFLASKQCGETLATGLNQSNSVKDPPRGPLWAFLTMSTIGSRLTRAPRDVYLLKAGNFRIKIRFTSNPYLERSERYQCFFGRLSVVKWTVVKSYLGSINLSFKIIIGFGTVISFLNQGNNVNTFEISEL